MDMNYTNTPVRAVNEPQVRTPDALNTVAEVTDELRRRIGELRDAATRVTEGMVGERIDLPEIELPDGKEASLLDRTKWMVDTLFRITEALRRTGDVLG